MVQKLASFKKMLKSKKKRTRFWMFAIVILFLFISIYPLADVLPRAASASNPPAATSFSGGTGSSSDPYIISTASELKFLQETTNSDSSGAVTYGKYYKLGANIDLSVYENWVPIGNPVAGSAWGDAGKRFRGYFDGAGYIISGMTATSTGTANPTYLGFFGAVRDAVIFNVTLKDITVLHTGTTSGNTNLAIGGLVGQAHGSKIFNCRIIGNSTITKINSATGDGLCTVGGLVGDLLCVKNIYSYLTNCYVEASVSSDVTEALVQGYVGGIVGRIRNQLQVSTNSASWEQIPANCVFVGSLTGNRHVGPLFGCFRPNNITTTDYSGLSGASLTDNSSSYYHCTTMETTSGDPISLTYNCRVDGNGDFDPFGIEIDSTNTPAVGAAAMNSNLSGLNTVRKYTNSSYAGDLDYFSWAENLVSPIPNCLGLEIERDDENMELDAVVSGASGLQTYSWVIDSTVVGTGSSLAFPDYSSNDVVITLTINDGGETATRNYTFPAFNLSVELSRDINTITASVSSNLPIGSSNLSYSWTVGGVVSSETSNQITLTSANLDSLVEVTVTYTGQSGTTVVTGSMLFRDTVIVYLDQANGNDTNDGSCSVESAGYNLGSGIGPVKTFRAAVNLLDPIGNTEKNIIILCGLYTSNCARMSNAVAYGTTLALPEFNELGVDFKLRGITINGVAPRIEINNYNSSNVLSIQEISVVLGQNTAIENVDLYMKREKISPLFWYCNGYDMTFGEGITMSNCGYLTPNHGAEAENRYANVHVMGGVKNRDANGNIIQKSPEGGFSPTITIKSGVYGRIMSGGRSGNTGSTVNPMNTTININITDSNNKSRSSTSYYADIGILCGGQTDSNYYGNPVINIQNGSITTLIGGSLGNIDVQSNGTLENFFYGDIDLNITGGTINNLYGGSLGRNNGNVKNEGNIDVSMSGGTINQNMFGGGAGGIVIGNISINVFGNALLTRNLFGGGYGYSQFLTAEQIHETAGDVTGNINVHVYGNATIGDSVYGGGAGTRYYYDTNPDGVLVDGIMQSTSSYAYTDGDVHVIIGEAGSTGTVTIGGNVFGAGGGVEGLPENAGMAEVAGTVTLDILDGVSISDVIYGGGEVANKIGDITVNVNTSSTLLAAVYGGSDKGNIDGNIILNVLRGTLGDAFGGNNHSGTISGTSTVNIGNATLAPSVAMASNTAVYGGGNVADHSGTATVNIYNNIGSIYNVCGGGKNAFVENTNVNLYGGQIMFAFGGGFYQGASSANITTTGGTVTGAIYGGSYMGDASGTSSGAVDTANITINGGTMGTVIDPLVPSGNSLKGIYGGGWGADTESENVNILINSDIYGHVYGGGDSGEVTGTSTVTVASGKTVTGRVFGGGYGANSITANAVVNINGVVDGHVYGGGEEGDVSVKSTVNILAGSSTTGNVFGAGIGINSQTNQAEVNVNGNIDGNLYGGGNQGSVGTSAIAGSTVLNVNGGATIRQSVFGAGRGLPAGGILYGTANVNIGTDAGTGAIIINGDVFAGGNRSEVNTTGYTGDATHIQIDGSVKEITIGGSVFGGGNSTREGASSAVENIVFGNTTVDILDSLAADNITIYGGIYGAGNASAVDGIRTINITNFGASTVGGKILRSVQRANTVNLVNSYLLLDGAIDKVEPTDIRLYSIDRVAQLNMDGSTISLNNNVKELGSIYSDVPTSAVSTDNTVIVDNGKWIEVKADSVYGDIIGLFNLSLKNAQPAEGGAYVYGSIGSYTNGSPTTSQGNFLSVDPSKNVVAVSIPTSYSVWYIEGTIYNYHVSLIGTVGETTATSTTIDLDLNNLYNATGIDIYIDSAQTTGLASDPLVTLDAVGQISTGGAIKTQPLIDETTPSLMYTQAQNAPFISMAGSGYPKVTVSLCPNATTVPSAFTLLLVLKDTASGGNACTYNISIDVKIKSETVESAVYFGMGKKANLNSAEDINITSLSSFSARFTSSYSPGFYSDLTLELNTTSAFPVGTKITMIDATDVTKYYYYICDSSVTDIPLSSFIDMGAASTTSYINRAGFSIINEDLIFMIDFSQTSGAVTGLLSLRHQYGGGDSTADVLINAPSVEYFVSTAAYSEGATISEASPYNTGSYIFDVNVSHGGSTDTRMTENGYALKVYLPNDASFPAVSDFAYSNDDGTTWIPVTPSNDNKSVIIPVGSLGEYKVRIRSDYAAFPTGNLTVNCDLYNGYSAENSLLYLCDTETIVFRGLLNRPEFDFKVMASNEQDRLISANAGRISLNLTYNAVVATVSNVTVELQGKTTGVALNENSYTTLTGTTGLPGGVDGVITLTSLTGTSKTIDLSLPTLVSGSTYRLLFKVNDGQNTIIEVPYNIVVQ